MQSGSLAQAIGVCRPTNGAGGTAVGGHGGAAAGLVPFSGTSDPREPGRYLVDATIGRLARMKRTVRAVARSVQEVALAGQGRVAPWLVTLTYAEVDGWGPRHVSAFLHCLRQWARRRGFEIPYVWTAELQKRGAVHYHVVVWLPVRISMPRPDKQGWWRYGMTNRVRARKPVGYLVKYASKGGDVVFPRGLRLCGYGGLTAQGRAVRYWLCLSPWLVRKAGHFQRVSRLPGGFWLLEGTGELVRSAWEFVRFDQRQNAIVFRRRIECDPHSPEWCDLRASGMDRMGRWWLGQGRDVLALRLTEGRA